MLLKFYVYICTISWYVSQIFVLLRDFLEGTVLDPVEDNELREIKKYLSEEQKQPKILLPCSGLKGVLGVKTNVFRDLVNK